MNQNAETELMLEGDDDAVSLLQEKEIDNLAGKFLNSFKLAVVHNKCTPRCCIENPSPGGLACASGCNSATSFER